VADLAASSPTTRHLFLSQTSQLAASVASRSRPGRVHKVEACRRTLIQARPAVLVMIGSDRFRPLSLYNMRSSLSARRRFPHSDTST
jgi:hypothetical protein